MKNLVYILGKGSRWRNNEIRYSLRSAEKYAPEYEPIIIGDAPEWVKNIKVIPAEDTSVEKLQNAREKYRVAANHPDISDPFVLMNDDFFFLKPFKEVFYTIGTLKEMIGRHPSKSGRYYQSLMNTKALLESLGIQNPRSFEAHAPITFKKGILDEIIRSSGTGKVFSIRSLYGNLTQSEWTDVTDFKASNIAEFLWQVANNREILSINDNLVGEPNEPAVRDWLFSRFPDPSRYEDDSFIKGNSTPTESVIGRLRAYAEKPITYDRFHFESGDIIPEEIAIEIEQNRRFHGQIVRK